MSGDSPEDVVNHIGNPEFGRGTEYEKFIAAIIETAPVELSRRHIFLTELYETVYGLKNHIHPNDSLGISSYKQNLDLEVIDPLKRHLNDYADLKINELYGMSLVEYLQQTPNVLRNIRKAAALIQKDERKAVNKLNDQLKEGSDE